MLSTQTRGVAHRTRRSRLKTPADLNKEIKEVRWKRQWAGDEMAGLFFTSFISFISLISL